MSGDLGMMLLCTDWLTCGVFDGGASASSVSASAVLYEYEKLLIFLVPLHNGLGCLQDDACAGSMQLL